MPYKQHLSTSPTVFDYNTRFAPKPYFPSNFIGVFSGIGLFQADCKCPYDLPVRVSPADAGASELIGVVSGLGHSQADGKSSYDLLAHVSPAVAGALEYTLGSFSLLSSTM